VKSFRPISLTSYLFKGLERIMYWDVMEKSPDIYNKNQHAFRKGRSTETALFTLVDRVESSSLRKEFAMATFLDISGAFDNLSPNKVVEAMERKQLGRPFIGWYAHYLRSRTANIAFGATSFSRKLTKGTPQGGVLSPFAWNITFDSLLEALSGWGVTPIGYADDCAVIASGIDLRAIESNLQRAVNIAVAWGVENGLTFSPSKSETILFTRKRESKNVKWNLQPIIISGQEIPIVKHAKYLGITFDKELTMTAHIKDKINKSRSKMGMIRSAVGIRWGPAPLLLKWCFSAIVRPALTYGSLVWGHRIGQSKRLDGLNRLALRGLAPMRDKTPTAGLEVLTDTMPLDILIRGEGLKAFQRNHEFLKTAWVWDRISKCPTVSTFNTWRNLAKGNGLALEREDTHFSFNWIPQLTIAKPDKSCILSQERTIAEIGARDKTPEGYIKIRRGEGLQVVRHYQANPTPRMGQMVCSLLTAACHLLIASAHTGDTVMFKIPKAATGMFAFFIKRRTAHECLEAIKLLRRRSPYLSYVRWKPPWPLSGRETFIQLKIPRPRGTFSDAVSQWCYTVWNNRWTNMRECGQTRFWVPKVDRELAKSILELPRNILGIVFQFTTGHCWLRRHQSIVDGSGSSACRLCGSDGDVYLTTETPIHLALNCPEAAKLSCFRENRIDNSNVEPSNVEAVEVVNGVVSRDSPGDNFVNALNPYSLRPLVGLVDSIPQLKGFRGRAKFSIYTDSSVDDRVNGLLGTSGSSG